MHDRYVSACFVYRTYHSKRMYVAHAYAQPANVRTYVRTFGQTVGADHEKCMAGIPLSAYVESHKDNF